MNRNFFTQCSAINYSAGEPVGMDCVARRRTDSDDEDPDEEEEDALVAARAGSGAVVAAPAAAAIAPFHYLINEQAKSIVALQELQNEVGALLEFRDLVMETFPHLRQKTAPSTPRQYHQHGALSHIPVATSLQGKRDWEPGVRVKRKLHQHSRDQDTSVPSLAAPRSRSNSHGKGPKSAGGGGEAAANSGTSSAGSSAVQDSGFCAESKEHCSTATTASSTGGTPAAGRKGGGGGGGGTEQEAEDELWNLLDIIHIKGTKLRLEVEHLQEKLEKQDRKVCIRRSRSLEFIRKGVEPPRTKCDLVLENEMRSLKLERDVLLDRIADMESENLANLAQTNQLLAEMGVLSAEKRDLEEQLRAAVSTKTELNSRIHDLHLQFVNRAEGRGGTGKQPVHVPAAKAGRAGAKAPSGGRSAGSSQVLAGGEGSCFAPVARRPSAFGAEAPRPPQVDPFARPGVGGGGGDPERAETENYLKEEDGFRIEDRRPSDPVSERLGSSDTPKTLEEIIADNDVLLNRKVPVQRLSEDDYDSPALSEDAGITSRSSRTPRKVRLGTLDGIVSSPSPNIKGAKGVTPDKKKTAAILTEFNPLELQRHLLVTTFQNQVANHRIERISRSQVDLAHQLEKFKDENDDLRFQLEEKSIELEGTRARIRLLERLQSTKYTSELSESVVSHSHTLLPPSHESTPNPILPHIALPITLDEPQIHHSSSTESAHHDEDLADEKRSDSPKKRPPSKIPLKSYTAPKPPTGRTKATTPSHKSSKESQSLGRNRDASKSREMSMHSRSRESSVGGKTGSRESLREPPPSMGRRMRKSSAQDGSYSSTGSSHSVRNNPTPSPASKKIQAQASRDRIGSQDQNEHKKVVATVGGGPERFDKTEEFLDSLDGSQQTSTNSNNYTFLNPLDNQELDRSLASVAQSKAWRVTPQSTTQYFDGIDNSTSGFNQSMCSYDQEALAESDSLDPSCSECGDLV